MVWDRGARDERNDVNRLLSMTRFLGSEWCRDAETIPDCRRRIPALLERADFEPYIRHIFLVNRQTRPTDLGIRGVWPFGPIHGRFQEMDPLGQVCGIVNSEL